MSVREALVLLVQLAGLGQLVLCVMSVAIPRALDWRGQLASTPRLLQQEFYVYAGYIWSINASFAAVSLLGAPYLVEPGPLAAAVCAFIFLYWAARVVVQAVVFDLSHLDAPHMVLARRGLELLFVFLSVVYGLALLHALQVLPGGLRLPDVGPLARMVLIIGVLMAVVKLLVASLGPPLPRWGRVAFVMWPGMRPAAFQTRARPKLGADLAWGAFFFALGAALAFLVNHARARGLDDGAAGVLGLIPLSLMLHFGLLRLGRGLLGAIGYDVEQLFVLPMAAHSLAAFWGRRWNVAFSDMVRALALRPARSALASIGLDRFAGPVGVGLGFLLSALLHEAAITLPVGAGFGGPMVYFMVHGALVLMERWRPWAAWRGRHPRLSRLYVWAALVMPLPVLFPPAFRAEIVLPLLSFFGA
jgi:hypothetical protein